MKDETVAITVTPGQQRVLKAWFEVEPDFGQGNDATENVILRNVYDALPAEPS